MHIGEQLLGLTLVGATWVFWLLIVLSMVSVAVMVERAIRLAGKPIDLDAFGKELIDSLSQGDVNGARKFLKSRRSPEVDVVSPGVEQFERGPAAVSAAMAGAKSKLRIDLEKNLGILGTLGNNAPFIGLFGTVLGIIRSFADLSRSQGTANSGMSVVISGIAEALVATALGLLVAIPAVVAFNYFQNKIRRILGRVDVAAQAVLVALPPPVAETARKG
ncbi:MAG TPA: MotA/TolQ/ExbB proton channel family protein [Polyangia bacterium]|jgi:biopolymer transport protein ExbB|nr:MotA/TolQ/ExbB proton channel family protein [Polyangia bacterium]